jgi:2-methylcitrate dehydratase
MMRGLTVMIAGRGCGSSWRMLLLRAIAANQRGNRVEASAQEIGSDHRSGVQMLAEWALAVRSDDIPATCLNQAKLLLLDSIGCAIAGHQEDVCKGVLAVCDEVGGKGPCTIIGQPSGTDMARAVLANGTMLRVLDLNDYVVVQGKHGPQIGGHPSDNIAVALAVGEARGSSGRDVLASIVLGYEAFGRLKGLMDRKAAWDGVTISGFVVPVMAGRLMGLDAARLAHALALGGARAATPGIVRHGGISAAKSIANALVAESGVEATLLAEQGLTGPLAILEHERGMRTVFPLGDIADTMDPGLPAKPYIMLSNVKAYPCVATAQSAAAAALDIHHSLEGRIGEIAQIEVAMIDTPFIHEQQNDPKRAHPRSRESADHSFQYVVAVALTDGAFGPAQFEGERWLDPAILALMGRIEMTRDAALNVHATGTYPCVITVRERNGKEHRAERLFPPGYSRGGIAQADVVDKFNAVAGELPADRRARIIAAVLNLDRAASLVELTAALRG